jgi:hypothetical protein
MLGRLEDHPSSPSSGSRSCRPRRPLGAAFILSALFIALSPNSGICLDGSPDSDQAAATASQPIQLADALHDLQEAITAKQVAIEEIREARRSAADETASQIAEAQLGTHHAEAQDLQQRFNRLMTQADEGLFTEKAEEPFDPTSKVLGLLQPVFEELEKLTATSREISRLEATRDLYQKRATESSKAMTKLAEVGEEELGPEVRKSAVALEQLWNRRLKEAEAQTSSIDYELSNLRESQQPFLDSATGFLRTFLRTRGFNLFLGILAFGVVFLSLNFIRSFLTRSGGGGVGGRVADLIFRALAIAASVSALLFVFNLAGDWFLLGIALAFLLGLGWVAVKAAPQFAQQITLILNMGAVREGEFIIFEGLPWKVDTLGFTATLTNDRLEGGVQAIPVRMLVGMHSRALGPREELFPCCAGDWVRLADDTTGQIDYQTPAVVQISLLGGARKTYATTSFVDQQPTNLSANFRIEFPFGIGYRHQPEATTSIPVAMEAALNAGLKARFKDAILNVDAELKEAAASSLDYEIQIDVAGSAAGQYEDIERAAVAVLVDACNENDWEIPFQQITLHRDDAN